MSQRAAIFAAISPGYSGLRHFFLVNALALPVIGGALWQVRAPSLGALLVVPLALLIANYAEWALHRYLLHRRVPAFRLLYERHAVMHHGAFHHDSMAAPTPREWRWVLFPLPALLALLTLVGPLAALLGRFSPNGGWLLLACWTGFYLLYEWCHLSYHQPPQSFVARLWLVRVLRRHHQRHHHPRYAKRYNFNVTVPLFDWIRGTALPRSLAAEVTRESDGGGAR